MFEVGDKVRFRGSRYSGLFSLDSLPIGAIGEYVVYVPDSAFPHMVRINADGQTDCLADDEIELVIADDR